MSSSIEEEFNPSDDLTRDEVIAMAKRYVQYWKIEALYSSNKYWSTLEELTNLRREIQRINDDLKRQNNEQK